MKMKDDEERRNEMRRMTYEEFTKMIRDKEIFPDLAGVTEEEIDTMFYFFNLGRQSVRW